MGVVWHPYCQSAANSLGYFRCHEKFCRIFGGCLRFPVEKLVKHNLVPMRTPLFSMIRPLLVCCGVALKEITIFVMASFWLVNKHSYPDIIIDNRLAWRPATQEAVATRHRNVSIISKLRVILEGTSKILPPSLSWFISWSTPLCSRLP